MKTNTNKNTKQNKNTGLLNRPEQLGTSTRPKIDVALRRANRKLNTDSVVELLRERAPNFFAVAEVVGKWVWVQFAEKQPSEVTRNLAELGFHWNNARQTWQHPCGTIAEERATYDPRKRYGSYFPATKPA